MGTTWIQITNVGVYPPFQVQWFRKLGLQWKNTHGLTALNVVFSLDGGRVQPWGIILTFFTFVFPTKKMSITGIIYPVPYWGRDYLHQNITIFLISLYLFNPEDYGYIYSWCKFRIKLYTCSKWSLSVVSSNYKFNWHDWFFFCLFSTQKG